MARGIAFRIAATLLAAASMATPAVETDGIGLLADAVMAAPAVDDLPIIMSCPPTFDVLPDLYTEAADAWSTAVIEEIQAKTSLAVWKSTSAPRADNSSLSRFTAMTRPSWLGRAVRNRHRHAIEQASRRWRGGERDD